MMKTFAVVFCLAASVLSARAGFKVDRSAMSDKYWEIWNDQVQAKIDADIEKYRKADALFEVDAPAGTEVKVEQVSSAFFFGGCGGLDVDRKDGSYPVRPVSAF